MRPRFTRVNVSELPQLPHERTVVTTPARISLIARLERDALDAERDRSNDAMMTVMQPPVVTDADTFGEAASGNAGLDCLLIVARVTTAKAEPAPNVALLVLP